MKNHVNSISYFINILKDINKIKWQEQLYVVLCSPGLKELPNNPELCRAEFFLNIAKQRLQSTVKQGITTFGLEDLINSLEKLPPDTLIARYGLKSPIYFGDCFVCNSTLIGCGFVINGHSCTLYSSKGNNE